MSHIKFAQNLRALRLSHELSQEALAENIGIKRSRLSSWEEYRAEPSISMLLKIAGYFQVSVDKLLTEKIEIKLKSLMKK